MAKQPLFVNHPTIFVLFFVGGGRGRGGKGGLFFNLVSVLVLVFVIFFLTFLTYFFMVVLTLTLLPGIHFF